MYENFYLLKKKPFENTPNPEFLYLSRNHGEVLASLLYAINFAKGFVLVTGDAGTGKTILIQALIKELGANAVVTHVRNPQFGFTEIIRHLSKNLDLPFNDQNNTFDSYHDVKSKLEQMDKAGKRVVLIIDEAHLLSEKCLEEIRLLSNHETENRKLIQIVLVGQNGIYDMLQKDSLKSLRQRIVINRELNALDMHSVPKYIRHRLRVAGRETPLFDRKALLLIGEKSRGVPRIINRICDNALMRGYTFQTRKIGTRIVKDIIEEMATPQAASVPTPGNKKKITKAAVSAGVISLFILILLTGHFSKSKPVKDTGELAVDGMTLHQSETAEIPSPTLMENSGPPIHAGTLPVGKPVPPKPVEEKPAAPLHQEGHAVSPNPCLSETARDRYGIGNDTIVDLIHMANPTLRSVKDDCTGRELVYPEIEKADLIREDSDGTCTIHYASFYRIEPAAKLVEELMQRNENAMVVKSVQGDDPVFRVVMGKYETRTAAERALAHLEFNYLPFLQGNPVRNKKVLLDVLENIQ